MLAYVIKIQTTIKVLCIFIKSRDNIFCTRHVSWFWTKHGGRGNSYFLVDPFLPHLNETTMHKWNLKRTVSRTRQNQTPPAHRHWVVNNTFPVVQHSWRVLESFGRIWKVCFPRPLVVPPRPLPPCLRSGAATTLPAVTTPPASTPPRSARWPARRVQ